MTPAARKRPTRRGPRLTYVMQLRLTPEQAAQLGEVVDASEQPLSMSSLVRNIVGVWLINNAELQGAELERAVSELIELADEEAAG